RGRQWRRPHLRRAADREDESWSLVREALHDCTTARSRGDRAGAWCAGRHRGNTCGGCHRGRRGAREAGRHRDPRAGHTDRRTRRPARCTRARHHELGAHVVTEPGCRSPEATMTTAWIAAARLRTLPAAVVPVLVGTAVAHATRTI